jgi:hypothetical protein
MNLPVARTDEVEALREEVRQLKAMLGDNTWRWPLSWGLSRKPTIILNLLVLRERASKSALVAAIDDGKELSAPVKNVEVHVWHLRRKLKAAGVAVTINTSVGLGYWLSAEDRARLRAIVEADGAGMSSPRRKRSPRRGTVDFENLVAANAAIDTLGDNLRRNGYERGSVRAHKRRDGTFTVRCVWRQRGVLASAVTCSVQGLVL